MKTITINKLKYYLEPMAIGGVAHIYRAVAAQDSNNRRVVKILREAHSNDDVIVARFDEEYRVLKRLQDEPIFFVRDLVQGISDKQHYLSYSYVAGETLLQCLKFWRAENFAPVVCCAVMERVLAALATLHNRTHPIVHSDVSPENIIVSGNSLYLIDMGCAQTLSDESPTAQRWIGKPSYLSPEQARGEAWTQSSDIFQAGIVFYEILSGKRWNQGSSQEEKKEFASDPREMDLRHLPVEVRPVLRSMLKAEPTQRASSAVLCQHRIKFARLALQKKQ